jgi:ectoine hydroxylase-related dioxygenase (phytanoyl-CoA dioxygenase family)
MTPNFAEHGVEIRRGMLTEKEIDCLVSEVSLDSEVIRSGGIRNLEKKFASIAGLTRKSEILNVVQDPLEARCQLVRAIFFDKTPEKNWFVSWHQDRTVTLNRKADLPGWGPWTVNDGVCHVQPACAVLDHMVTIRLHLDPADESNGCLWVIPSSHRYGILRQAEIEKSVGENAAVPCTVRAGDAVLMRPHILHSSKKSIGPNHRRVVHLEFSDYQLPDGIHWA